MRPGLSAAAALVNRMLADEEWARERLAAHAGRTFAVALGPAKATFAVDAEGRLADSAAAPDLTITISPFRLPELVAQPERWNELAAASGDTALAKTIGELAQTLPWFVERALSGAFGSIAGQALADAGRRLLTLPAYMARRTGDSVGSYLRDEAGVGVRAAAGSDRSEAIAALVARVDLLGERVARLASRPAKTFP